MDGQTAEYFQNPEKRSFCYLSSDSKITLLGVDRFGLSLLRVGRVSAGRGKEVGKLERRKYLGR